MSRDLVFEIGSEEIPSAPLYAAIAQLEKLATKVFDEARLTCESIDVMSTPRRLTLFVTNLEESQSELELRVKGPAVRAAYDDAGNPTKALEGFARSRGVDVGELVREEEGGGEYVFAYVREAAKPTLEVLPELLARLCTGLDWPKSMRWASGTTRFVRPVRWLLALYGTDVVPVEFGGLTADRLTWGHRFLSESPVTVADADGYAAVMREAHVCVDHRVRRDTIREAIDRVAQKHGGRAVVPDKTFDEVVNLVEYPTVAVGHFDEDFLEVPREVLENAMESHQRYFPLEAPDGTLMPYFIVAHNGNPKLTDAIIPGHERVIRARLADAAFFYREDLSKPLEAYVAQLDSIVFQEKLGTSGAKVRRNVALAEALAEQAGSDAAEAARAKRASHLAKADLVSNVVVEFPTLQGVMGSYYALAAGETPEVALAIVEHYRPRFAGDDPPSTVAGQLVSVADKLDTICGIFAAGLQPTGSADPYALRRSALGILSIIVSAGLRLRLDEAISSALAGYGDVLPELDVDEVGAAVKTFILGRMETVLKERGHAYDTVAAVLAAAGDDPYDALMRAVALTPFRAGDDARDLSIAFARAKNLSQPALGHDTDNSLMSPEEDALQLALDTAEEAAIAAIEAHEYTMTLEIFAALRGPIDDFFDKVLVMDEDPRLRENRLRLLNRFVALFSRFADFSELAD